MLLVNAVFDMNTPCGAIEARVCATPCTDAPCLAQEGATRAIPRRHVVNLVLDAAIVVRAARRLLVRLGLELARLLAQLAVRHTAVCARQLGQDLGAHALTRRRRHRPRHGGSGNGCVVRFGTLSHTHT